MMFANLARGAKPSTRSYPTLQELQDTFSTWVGDCLDIDDEDEEEEDEEQECRIAYAEDYEDHTPHSNDHDDSSKEPSGTLADEKDIHISSKNINNLLEGPKDLRLKKERRHVSFPAALKATLYPYGQKDTSKSPKEITPRAIFERVLLIPPRDFARRRRASKESIEAIDLWICRAAPGNSSRGRGKDKELLPLQPLNTNTNTSTKTDTNTVYQEVSSFLALTKGSRKRRREAIDVNDSGTSSTPALLSSPLASRKRPRI
ncbi:hypothetical protein TWF102_008662 [Orbilia oligospora]|uniref:Uncharacterized protein n=1 Tax=Orbilia oligospora TaxID=2813651 RepID=A0A7C8J3F1_ORBOL|nr:hypothetical protein TWF102_008662 [Orbilia oligospora]KAF3100568.1 hypothetical protein TWF706_006125 [Orbilia oligospora]KAF3101401.1 hypothetical protein TWF103_007972 [Orbilia oligospora]KAF3119817.1 hypothetical protein TWF703_003022 [Orbilia oligospora]KAF3130521.1 hypothetical protein TWF594_010278 [Orbilia oligospora]